MNSHAMVQHALQCLQDLDLHSAAPQSAAQISRRQHLPLKLCLQILHRLAGAGLVQFQADGRVCLTRGLDELMPDEILDAIWVTFKENPPVVMLLNAPEDRQIRVTRAAFELAQLVPASVSASAWC